MERVRYDLTEADLRVVDITQLTAALTKWSGPNPGVVLTLEVSSSRYVKASSSYCCGVSSKNIPRTAKRGSPLTAGHAA